MDAIENRIYSTFASVASSIGFSEVHGRIIAALLVSGKQMSLDELTKKTGYSSASISLSLDLLELVGIVKRIKNTGDRKLYVKIEGDLLQALRNAMLLKINKNIVSTLSELDNYKKRSDKKTRESIITLEKEIMRLEKYIEAISKIEVPALFKK